MKFLIPLLSSLLCMGGFAQAGSWTTLTKIGDKLLLQAGEIALVTSVSEPIYLTIEPPQKSSSGLRLHPVRRYYYDGYSRSGSYAYRRTQEVSWKNPFPISGPCSIRLGTAAVVSIRVVSTGSE